MTLNRKDFVAAMRKRGWVLTRFGWIPPKKSKVQLDRDFSASLNEAGVPGKVQRWKWW